MISLLSTDLNKTGTVALRRIARELGLKGMSSARGDDLRAAIVPIQMEQQAEAAKAKTTEIRKTAKGKCTDCGRKEGFRLSGLCDDCREYAEWENTHSDNGHEVLDGVITGEFSENCPVCRPELDPRTPIQTRTAKAGMEVVAKGDKVQVFKAAAEAAGFTVTIQVETYEGGNTRTYATAVFGGIKGEHIVLAWVGSAYDYPNSEASKDGKVRKVRNLKEALRLLER